MPCSTLIRNHRLSVFLKNIQPETRSYYETHYIALLPRECNLKVIKLLPRNKIFSTLRKILPPLLKKKSNLHRRRNFMLIAMENIFLQKKRRVQFLAP